jgi:hypothetical protein
MESGLSAQSLNDYLSWVGILRKIKGGRVSVALDLHKFKDFRLAGSARQGLIRRPVEEDITAS